MCSGVHASDGGCLSGVLRSFYKPFVFHFFYMSRSIFGKASARTLLHGFYPDFAAQNVSGRKLTFKKCTAGVMMKLEAA